MVQAERLAAVGQTIAALSHHIKNILQGLHSGGEILKMGLKDKDDNLLSRAGRSSRRTRARSTTWSWTCSATRRSASRPSRTTDLNGVVRDVVELLTPRAEELGVELEAQLADDAAERARPTRKAFTAPC